MAIAENSPVFAETQALKKSIHLSVFSRDTPYINAQELDKIVAWKLDSQYPRSRDLRSLNLDDVVIPISRACLAVSSLNSDYSLDLKVKILSTLRGIATPLASAVLALVEPEKFGVIDSVLWRFLTGQDKQAFSTSDYKNFLTRIQELSKLTGLSIQEAEHALWIYASTK
jgi:hypothetical protein